ncbi:MAG: glutamine synthetase [Micromonosporaceae bacterium]
MDSPTQTLTEPLAEHAEVAAALAEQGVRYALGGWIDVLGRSKSKVVPVDHLPQLLAGSERYTPRGLGYLDVMRPEEDECVAMPDLATLTVLPWDRRFAWMAADLLFGGREPWALCPRSILKRQVARAGDLGYTFNLGIETEFYAFQPSALDGEGQYLTPIARSGSIKPSPGYDIESTFDAMPFLDQMVACMQETGFGVYSFDHEGGDGQFEFDFGYAPALQTADRISLFRLMVRQVAKQCGLVATFMPKPYPAAWGSGHHFNMSLAEVDSGHNLFRDTGDPRGRGWSKLAYAFTAGILRHAPALAAVATPTVNSYKRLTPRLPDGSVSWAPIWAAYGDNNRSCMLRLPRNRAALENRAVDSAANTYLTAALMLAAGLSGIAENLDPGEPVESLTYDWNPRAAGARRLPRNLLEAIEAFEADPLVHEVYPAQFITAYVDMKHAEWEAYHAEVSTWERNRYLLDL